MNFFENDPSARSAVVLPQIELPAWLVKRERELVGRKIVDVADRLRIVIDLACENIRRGTGGPFGAAIFERSSNRLFALGVNLVVPHGQSLAHAEMMALARAHKLSGELRLEAFELVASCEPCIMCTGATLWSGVRSLVYGSPESDAWAIGFEEGMKPVAWDDDFRRHGIAVLGPMLPDESVEPFRIYQRACGTLY